MLLFVIALPRNESARLMKIEQDNDMLKLERDNLFDKLEIIKRNTNESLQSVAELEEDYERLKNMTKKIKEDMHLSTPAKPINPIIEENIQLSDNNQVNDPYMNNINGMNLINQNTTPSPNINYNKSLNQNTSSNIKNSINQNLKSLKMSQNSDSKKSSKRLVKRFKNGIISNILRNENEILNITQRIQGYLNKEIHYN